MEGRTDPARVLFIDAYDSFANNIISMLEECLDVEVDCYKIDSTEPEIADLSSFVRRFDAVVAGPGPGSPNCPDDVGFMNQLWHLDDKDLRPTLGICLGFQSLALSFGATIERLHEAEHGIVSRIVHADQSIFNGVRGLRVTRYHSLHAVLDGPSGNLERTRNGKLENSRNYTGIPRTTCPQLMPLAWVLDDEKNGPILMGLKHVKKPFWGLQYHPESICSNSESLKVIENWWLEVQRWYEDHPTSRPTTDLPFRKRGNTNGHQEQVRLGLCPYNMKNEILDERSSAEIPETPSLLEVKSKTVQMAGSLERLVYDGLTLGSDESDLVFLDSAVPRQDTGRFSILGFISGPGSKIIEYNNRSQKLRIFEAGAIVVNGAPGYTKADSRAVWHYLEEFMRLHQAVDGQSHLPFWGGLIGYISYELGLDSIDVRVSPMKQSKNLSEPDLLFIYVERSLVIDHSTNEICIQSIRLDDEAWLTSMETKVTGLLKVPRAVRSSVRTTYRTLERRQPRPSFTGRNYIMSKLENGMETTVLRKGVYMDKVRECQRFIRAGESYELCLTNHAILRVPSPNWPDYAWDIYRRLRERNPAPFGAYFNVGPVTILSCSPERFLRWDRQSNFEMRPIKGTVSKRGGVTLNQAEEILKTPKEQAENLMIVDLIRHDMHGVLGSGAVKVKSLMKVEEYESVYQLVSVIEGDGRPSSLRVKEDSTRQDRNTANDHGLSTGLRLLSSSLPPGSMTGAPKKRSCEILESLEKSPRRAIYSGVFGYMCAGGGGDFAVMIRSAFRGKHETDVWSEPRTTPTTTSATTNSTTSSTDELVDDIGAADPKTNVDQVRHGYGSIDTWRFGAGGAVTALSDPQAEYDEMTAKLNSTMNPFMDIMKEIYGRPPS